MHILGIDPGLRCTGLGLIAANARTLCAKEWFTIETSLRQSFPERLCELKADLSSYLQRTKPHLAVVEKLFFATNTRTAMNVAECRGVILCTLQEKNIPIIEPTPLALKAAITGDGKADKIQMQTMTQRLLCLSAPPKPDDAADALALAIYGALARDKIPSLSPPPTSSNPSS